MTHPDREDVSRELAQDEAGLSRRERSKVKDSQRLSALTVFSVIRREGEEELHRPAASLWWSGIAAGFGISTSVLCQGLLYDAYEGHPQREIIAAWGYAMGFILVVLSRLQLFTENTLSVVLPLLAGPSGKRLYRTGRLWLIVLLANMIGTMASAIIAVTIGSPDSELIAAMLAVSRHAAESRGMEALLNGVPAGFFVAGIVWMLPSSKGFEIIVVGLFAWLIAAGGFTHVIAGSTEMFMLALHGDMSFGEAIGLHLLPTLIGNVIGGTGLFALLAYGQIQAEI
ncbi:formate/nitrite transporter family protein [Novosphingobium sp. PY1]|uniref:formate/nitrite transporter family protein n=1 Tax=Novosphingobium sp. PY1 TaxID=1882221 RepID=UPI001A8DF329|nr:formate/nitrite transporter family protein [Novosphingobium sp. PY1]GFM27368.1 putative uncharacterized protein [Novosphingobium sp. PY1]